MTLPTIGNVDVVNRQCTPYSAVLAGNCIETPGQGGNKITMCYCNDKDGCNSAPASVQASIFYILMATALSMFFTRG